MYKEDENLSRPSALRGLIPAAVLLLAVVVTAAVLAFMQPTSFKREAYIAPETPAPTPGVAVPVDAPASSSVVV